jgi:hypothetical protein
MTRSSRTDYPPDTYGPMPLAYVAYSAQAAFE